jgi:hypothetical protein
MALGLFGTPFVAAHLRQRFKGMSAGEIAAYFGNLGKQALDRLIGWASAAYRAATQGKS